MHLMIDLETLGTKPNAVVLTAGLVLFDHKLGIVDGIELILDVQEQLDAGRTISESTLKWWFSQGNDAKRIFDNLTGDGQKKKGIIMSHFCEALDEFIYKHNIKRKDLIVWGNGPTFDVTMVEDIFGHQGYEVPWKFWNICCLRTFNRATKYNSKHKREGVHHNALDDARYQAECVIKASGGKL